jgi:hypothetical protein
MRGKEAAGSVLDVMAEPEWRRQAQPAFLPASLLLQPASSVTWPSSLENCKSKPPMGTRRPHAVVFLILDAG